MLTGQLTTLPRKKPRSCVAMGSSKSGKRKAAPSAPAKPLQAQGQGGKKRTPQSAFKDHGVSGVAQIWYLLQPTCSPHFVAVRCGVNARCDLLVNRLLTSCSLLVNHPQDSSITIDSIVNILVLTNSDSHWLMVGSCPNPTTSPYFQLN